MTVLSGGFVVALVVRYTEGVMAKTYSATFLKRKRWWVAWSEDVPGALTQGKTLAEAKANLRDAIRLMLAPVPEGKLPKVKVVQDRVRA